MVSAIDVAYGVGGTTVAAFVALWAWARLTLGMSNPNIDMTGKTVIVTGANTGIGYEAAKQLVKQGARVIMACRDPKRGQAALDKLRTEVPEGASRASLKLLDVSLMESVRKFAKDILNEETKIDVLINNAGLTMSTKQMTSEGLELVFATNHFGHFLLTNLLIDNLRANQARVVNVSSLAHSWSKGLDCDNLCAEKGWDVKTIYGDSKLANVLFTRELARREDSKLVCASVHPGFVMTEFFRTENVPDLIVAVFLSLMSFVNIFGLRPYKTPFEGAQTTLYCATEPGLEKHSGSYFSDCKLAKESAVARDAGLAKKLWEASERITGLTK